MGGTAPLNRTAHGAHPPWGNSNKQNQILQMNNPQHQQVVPPAVGVPEAPDPAKPSKLSQDPIEEINRELARLAFDALRAQQHTEQAPPPEAPTAL